MDGYVDAWEGATSLRVFLEEGDRDVSGLLRLYS